MLFLVFFFFGFGFDLVEAELHNFTRFQLTLYLEFRFPIVPVLFLYNKAKNIIKKLTYTRLYFCCSFFLFSSLFLSIIVLHICKYMYACINNLVNLFCFVFFFHRTSPPFELGTVYIGWVSFIWISSLKNVVRFN